MVVFLGALGVWLWIAGLQLHHAYAAAAACHPSSSATCQNLIATFQSTNVILKGGFVLQPLPALIGAFVGPLVLARELETGTFRRLGGSRDIKVDVRFVFASNKNLTDCVERGSFREDLYHRINLLPIGQLDGGHVLYSLFGREQWRIAMITIFGLIGLGMYLVVTTGDILNVWFVWIFLAQIFGLRHPPPLDDITPLDRRRKLIGYATIVIFILIFTPIPFS